MHSDLRILPEARPHSDTCCEGLSLHARHIDSSTVFGILWRSDLLCRAYPCTDRMQQEREQVEQPFVLIQTDQHGAALQADAIYVNDGSSDFKIEHHAIFNLLRYWVWAMPVSRIYSRPITATSGKS